MEEGVRHSMVCFGAHEYVWQFLLHGRVQVHEPTVKPQCESKQKGAAPRPPKGKGKGTTKGTGGKGTCYSSTGGTETGLRKGTENEDIAEVCVRE